MKSWLINCWRSIAIFALFFPLGLIFIFVNEHLQLGFASLVFSVLPMMFRTGIRKIRVWIFEATSENFAEIKEKQEHQTKLLKHMETLINEVKPIHVVCTVGNKIQEENITKQEFTFAKSKVGYMEKIRIQFRSQSGDVKIRKLYSGEGNSPLVKFEENGNSENTVRVAYFEFRLHEPVKIVGEFEGHGEVMIHESDYRMDQINVVI